MMPTRGRHPEIHKSLIWNKSISVPDEGYKRNVSCTLNMISTLILVNEWWNWSLLSSAQIKCDIIIT
jgi:hypothetical protein